MSRYRLFNKNSSLAAFSGETAADLATDAEARKALAPSAAMKRKRSFSTSAVDLEGSLPSLAEGLHSAIGKGELTAVRSLCTDELARKVAGQAAGILSNAFKVGTMHVSTRTLTVHVDLKVSGAGASHKLTFDEAGLVSTSEIFTVAARS